MIPSVDEEKCIGCGTCQEICPAVFHLDEETEKSVIVDPEGCDFADCCEAAEENCPVEAISLS